jgi:hypothetical protein
MQTISRSISFKYSIWRVLKRFTNDHHIDSIPINLPLNEPKSRKKDINPKFYNKNRSFTFLEFWSSDFHPKSNLKFKFIQLRSRSISNKIYKSIEWSHMRWYQFGKVFLWNNFLWAFSVIVFLHFPIYISEFIGLFECQFDGGFITNSFFGDLDFHYDITKFIN